MTATAYEVDMVLRARCCRRCGGMRHNNALGTWQLGVLFLNVFSKTSLSGEVKTET